MDQLLANACVSWLCVLQPAVFFVIGQYIGRHGLRGALRRVHLRLASTFGPAYPAEREL